MFYCNDCNELNEDDCECTNCEGTDLDELGECVNCCCLSTLEQHDRNGLCGSDGNNCREQYPDGEGAFK